MGRRCQVKAIYTAESSSRSAERTMSALFIFNLVKDIYCNYMGAIVGYIAGSRLQARPIELSIQHGSYTKSVDGTTNKTYKWACGSSMNPVLVPRKEHQTSPTMKKGSCRQGPRDGRTFANQVADDTIFLPLAVYYSSIDAWSRMLLWTNRE